MLKIEFVDSQTLQVMSQTYVKGSPVSEVIKGSESIDGLLSAGAMALDKVVGGANKISNKIF